MYFKQVSETHLQGLEGSFSQFILGLSAGIDCKDADQDSVCGDLNTPLWGPLIFYH